MLKKFITMLELKTIFVSQRNMSFLRKMESCILITIMV